MTYLTLLGLASHAAVPGDDDLPSVFTFVITPRRIANVCRLDLNTLVPDAQNRGPSSQTILGKITNHA